VTNVANLDWPEALSSNATVEGELGIEMFGMVDLSVADKSTRTLSSGEEIPLTFQAQNNANSNDDIRIVIENQNELEEAGFTFPGGATLTVSVERVQLLIHLNSPFVHRQIFQKIFVIKSHSRLQV
jgi:hypothetical protein